MKPLAAAVVVVLGLSGCPQEAPKPIAAPAPTLPPPLDAARSIYTDFARAPASFDRVPHLSRYYVEDSQRKDAACNAEQNCSGDRFICLERSPKKAGQVTSAKLNGEQPGVSATAFIGLEFGAEKTTLEVDLVWEDGAWKIDQVRCPPAAN